MRIPRPLAFACLAALLVAACDRPSRFAVIAHRGASWDAPEHTFASWDLAVEQGADWLEFDLQRTADSVLVVLHDDSLDRVARGPAEDCTGPVRARTQAQLQRCDVGRWFLQAHPDRAKPEFVGQRIPTLEAVLSRYGTRAKLYLEIKDPDSAPGMEADLYAALKRHGLAGWAARERVLVQSFSAAALERLHALAPELPLVQLLSDSIPAAELDATLGRIASYAVGIGPSGRITDARLVERAHAKGLLVHPYTVNEEAHMSHFIALGVDGMFTDRPGVLLAKLAAR